MMASGLPLEAEILKVAHHGSNSSSSAAFLEAVRPKEAIISVGPNPYGHPRDEVLQRLADAGARVWRTDQVGTIIVTTSGVTYTVMPASAVVQRLYLPFLISARGAPRLTATPSITASPTFAATATPTPTLPATPTPTQTPVATSTPTPTRTVSPQARLRISCLSYSGRREYVCISNEGASPQDMTSWRLQSVVGDQWFTFPSGYVLGAGATVYVESGPDARHNPPTSLWWTAAYIWSNDGDEARLYNAAGKLVDSWAY